MLSAMAWETASAGLKEGQSPMSWVRTTAAIFSGGQGIKGVPMRSMTPVRGMGSPMRAGE